MILALLIAALVSFLVAAVAGYATDGRGVLRINFVALGLALWVVAQIVPSVH